MKEQSRRGRDYRRLFKGHEGTEGDLIPLLQKVQAVEGYVSKTAVRHISEFLKISENRIYGVASFYSQFRYSEPGRHSIKVCLGTACHVRGGQVLCDCVERDLGITQGETTEDRRFDFERVACLGCCALAPVVRIDEDIHSRMTVIRFKEIMDRYE